MAKLGMINKTTFFETSTPFYIETGSSEIRIHVFDENQILYNFCVCFFTPNYQSSLGRVNKTNCLGHSTPFYIEDRAASKLTIKICDEIFLPKNDQYVKNVISRVNNTGILGITIFC